MKKYSMSEQEGQRSLRMFEKYFNDIKDVHKAYQTGNPIYMPDYWHNLWGYRSMDSLGKSGLIHRFVEAGHLSAKYLLEHREIPPKSKRSFMVAAKAFISSRGRYRKFDQWWKKMSSYVPRILEGKTWAQRQEETSERKFGPFQLVDTLGTQDISKVAKVLLHAADKIRTRLPWGNKVLYGKILLVKKINQPNTIAWYYPSDDTVWLRTNVKGARSDVHNVIHELGHRYLNKFAPPKVKRAWEQHYDTIKRAGMFESPDRGVLQVYRDLKVGDVWPDELKGWKRGGRPFITKITPTSWHVENKKGQKARFGREKVFRLALKWSSQDKALALFPTPYSSVSADEFFCEAMALWCLGKLPLEHQQAFEDIVLKNAR